MILKRWFLKLKNGTVYKTVPFFLFMRWHVLQGDVRKSFGVKGVCLWFLKSCLECEESVYIWGKHHST